MGCNNLSSLPDISEWNTSKVTNMSKMFCCKNLKSLPDISEWNTSNVTDISGMFDGCDSLVNLPDISKFELYLKLLPWKIYLAIAEI